MKKSNNGYVCPKSKKPWEDSFGNFLPMADIKKQSRKWTPEIWERYLKTVETYQREMLCDDFDAVCDKYQTEEALHQIGNDAVEESSQGEPNKPNLSNRLEKEEIARLTHLLTPVEAIVIRCILWHSYTEEELARPLRRKQSTINKIKKRALMKLRRHAAMPSRQDDIHNENPSEQTEINGEVLSRET